MINNLHIECVDLDKYVYDTWIAETVHKDDARKIQAAVDKLAQETKADRLKLNKSKCKELQIIFSRSQDYKFPPTAILILRALKLLTMLNYLV